MSRPTFDRIAEEDDETSANGEDQQEQLDFDEEYTRWKSETDEVMGRLDQLRQSLDDRVAQVRAESLQKLFENAEDLEAMRSELERVKKMLRASQKFLVDDFTSSLTALRHSLATYSDVTREKLDYERKQPTAPGTLVRPPLNITCIMDGIGWAEGAAPSQKFDLVFYNAYDLSLIHI